MIAVLLDGGPFDGGEWDVTTPALKYVSVRRVDHEHPENNVEARYYPTAEVTPIGRMIFRYEAP